MLPYCLQGAAEQAEGEDSTRLAKGRERTMTEIKQELGEIWDLLGSMNKRLKEIERKLDEVLKEEEQ